MKNVVPLIMAVVLGLAAVYGVTRLVSTNAAEEEKKFTYVVAAARDIVYRDGEIKDSWIRKRRVEISSVPAKAIPWSQANQVVGQTVTRTVARNDYILSSDISGVDIRLANTVGAGEWAVPVTFADSKLVKFLKPGDEIAILAASKMKTTVSKRDQSQKSTEVEEDTMSVIFPCVRILDIGKGDGLRRSEDMGGDTIILALSPREAMTITAAQRQMELYPALRRANDINALRRRDVGIVNEKTFQDLKQNLETVALPDGTEK